LTSLPNRKVYERISQLVHSQDNYKTLRNSLRTLTPPCIPYLGMYLTDLTFIEDGNVDENQDGLINFNKRKMIAATILEIQSYQQPPYCLKPLPEFQQFIMNARKFTDTDLLYNFSHYMEPRENAPQPAMPPELAEIVEIKENLKARRKLAKSNAPKTKKAQKRKSTKQKKKEKSLSRISFQRRKQSGLKQMILKPTKPMY